MQVTFLSVAVLLLTAEAIHATASFHYEVEIAGFAEPVLQVPAKNFTGTTYPDPSARRDVLSFVNAVLAEEERVDPSNEHKPEAGAALEEVATSPPTAAQCLGASSNPSNAITRIVTQWLGRASYGFPKNHPYGLSEEFRAVSLGVSMMHEAIPVKQHPDCAYPLYHLQGYNEDFHGPPGSLIRAAADILILGFAPSATSVEQWRAACRGPTAWTQEPCFQRAKELRRVVSDIYVMSDLVAGAFADEIPEVAAKVAATQVPDVKTTVQCVRYAHPDGTLYQVKRALPAGRTGTVSVLCPSPCREAAAKHAADLCRATLADEVARFRDRYASQLQAFSEREVGLLYKMIEPLDKVTNRWWRRLNATVAAYQNATSASVVSKQKATSVSVVSKQ